ncbi:MAG: hypothetical protein AAF108_02380 [Planctomycetota bacterium]
MVSPTNLFTAARVQPTDDLRSPAGRRDIFSPSDSSRRSADVERRPAAETLTREQLIDRIVAVNPTATELFLSSFSDDELGSYLDHLTVAQAPRTSQSRWTRRPGVPAVAVHVVRA